MTLNVNATNGGTNCSANPGGLLYGVSVSCPACAANQFNDATVCGCTLCSTPLPGCNTCDSRYNCLTCLNNSYILFNGNCSACSDWMEGCKTCSDKSTCASCKTGYTLDSTNNICTKVIFYVYSNSTVQSCQRFGAIKEVDFPSQFPKLKWLWNEPGGEADSCSQSCSQQTFKPQCLG